MIETQFKSISRREFLKFAGAFCIAGVIAACGVETNTTQPPTTQSPTKQHPKDTGGEQRLQTEFNLTPLNAQTFRIFIENRNTLLGRRNIASQLHISSNTLKDHITRIIRHVRYQGYTDVSTLNDAVNVVVTNFGFD